MPRFALVLFPMFAILARWGERPWVNNVDPRILAAAARAVHRAVRGLVLGCLNATLHAIAARRGVRQFVKFGIVGASGFLVNLVVFTLLQRVVPNHAEPLQYDLIYSVAFLAGGVSNYFLNRIWTFRSTGHAVREGRAVPERLGARTGRRTDRLGRA